MSDQFKVAAHPSKVLHIRNLPAETTHQELVDLTSAFGTLSKTKLNVGPNRNQAFVEFADLDSASRMVTWFAGNAEPAKLRGKNVYLQYSNRQEVTNATTSAEPPGNVLLVGLDGLSPDANITIDLLHTVFSMFGFVCKIAIFEKSGVFQTLVQYQDPQVAKAAREALDGNRLPDYALPPGAVSPVLRIVYSAHTNLNVKFQSHRSRDYTDPYLPTGRATIAEPLNVVSSGTSSLVEGNVLLATIDNMAYPLTASALHSVFSPYGAVQKIAIFDKNNHTQALVQYPDSQSAAHAKLALEGHAIFEGGYNLLRLSYSVHRDLSVKGNSDKSWDYTLPADGAERPTEQRGSAGNTTTTKAPGAGNELHLTGEDFEKAHEELVRRAKEAGGQGPPAAQPPLGGPPGGIYSGASIPPPAAHHPPPAGPAPPAAPPAPIAISRPPAIYPPPSQAPSFHYPQGGPQPAPSPPSGYHAAPPSLPPPLHQQHHQPAYPRA